MEEKITVKAPQQSYDILIRDGLHEKMGEVLTPLIQGAKVGIVTNETLAPIYGEKIAQQFPQSTLITVPDGEEHKTLTMVNYLYEKFLECQMDRTSFVLALGGGVIGDTVGFAAATYLRGVRLVQVPTSLLAMVDSCVGGKVGVDLPAGKNLVGAFKQPCMILIDPQTLHTLPDNQWRCGLGEVLKYGLLGVEELLQSENYKRANAFPLILSSVKTKVRYVEEDPFEKNIRAHLNLGHTFAHAIEKVSQYRWPHGEAVGIGLLAATRLSHLMGLCSPELFIQTKTLLEKIGLPTRLGELDPEKLIKAMQTDKKKTKGKLRFVLLRDIGKIELVSNVPPEKIEQVWRELL